MEISDGNNNNNGVKSDVKSSNDVGIHDKERTSCNNIDHGVSKEEESSVSHNHNRSSSSNSSVKFANVTIREFNLVVGDHPDCSDGPPLAMGWNYVDQDAVRVDDFEMDKKYRYLSKSIRNNIKMASATTTMMTSPQPPLGVVHRLSPIERNKRLRREFNVPEEDIMNAMNEIQRIQKNRSETKYEMEQIAARQVYVIDTCLRTILVLCAMMYLFF